VTALQLLFYGVAAAMVLTALAMVLSRNIVHAALLMVGHFLLTALLYVLLRAPFIAVVQVAVYAGAIMVLFLFVVMLVGNRPVELEELLTGRRAIGIASVVVLGGLLVYAVWDGAPAAVPGSAQAVAAESLPADFGSPGDLADLMFRDYLLPLEVVSALLLVAMLGAVVVGRQQLAGPANGPGAPDDAIGDDGPDRGALTDATGDTP